MLSSNEAELLNRLLLLHQQYVMLVLTTYDNARLYVYTVLSSFSSYTSGQLDVFRHDSYSLGVDSTQVGVLK